MPEVMDAIYYKRGHHPTHRRGGEIARLGARDRQRCRGRARGPDHPDRLGTRLHARTDHPHAAWAAHHLVAAGAGAGIAATFNTPIGGVLFATELMMPEISVNTFLPVALATGTATFIGRLFFGPQPAFDVPAELAPLPTEPSVGDRCCSMRCSGADRRGGGRLHPRPALARGSVRQDPGRLPAPHAGHAAGRHSDVRADARRGPLLRRGRRLRDDPGDAGRPDHRLPGSWLLLFLCKLLATSLSLGSGSSGGIFSPSLFMGATLGGAFAALVSCCIRRSPISVPAFAMVGMGAMVGGGTGAAMTAVTMIFEMTRDYDIVLPMILAVALALGVRRLLSRENIYTLKLVRRGHPIPEGAACQHVSGAPRRRSDGAATSSCSGGDASLRRSCAGRPTPAA